MLIKSKRAFTLIELLVTIGVIAMIAMLVSVIFGGKIKVGDHVQYSGKDWTVTAITGSRGEPQGSNYGFTCNLSLVSEDGKSITVSDSIINK